MVLAYDNNSLFRRCFAELLPDCIPYIYLLKHPEPAPTGYLTLTFTNIGIYFYHFCCFLFFCFFVFFVFFLFFSILTQKLYTNIISHLCRYCKDRDRQTFITITNL